MGRLIKIDDSKRGAAVYQSTVEAPHATASTAPTAAPRTVSGTEAAKSLQASFDAARKSGNRSFERSGKTRDAYDSSVRSGYRQRQQGLLEQATDAGASNGGIGSMGTGTSGGSRGGRTPSKLQQFGWSVEDTIDKAGQATQDLLNLDLYLKNKEDARKAEIASGAKNDNGKNASAGQIAGNSIRKGMSQANKAFTSGLDFIMPTDFLGKYDPFSNLSSKYKDIYESIQEQQAYNLADRSKATKLASEVGSSVISALPNALLSVMSSGYSAASQLAPHAAGISSYIMNGIQSMSKNPMYWTSFVNTVGNEYENAVSNGAGKASAALAAITSSLINSGIEVGGGIETLPGELRNGDVNRLAAWFKSGIEEGTEELWQGGVSNAVNKLMADNKAPVFSTTDENAVINPKRMANEFGMDAATGLILSGGQLLATPGQQGGYKDEIRAKGAQTNPELQQVLDSVNEVVNGQKNNAQQGDGKVIADTTLFDHGILSNFNKARTKFLEFARKHFPSSVKNIETGKEIGIGRNGLDKFLSGNIYFEKYASGFHIPELIQNAHKVGEAPNYHGDVPGIPSYEYYDSAINIDGTDYLAHIRVRNTAVGDKYYGHTISMIDDIQIEPPTRASSANSQSVQSVKIGDSISSTSIPQSQAQYNPNFNQNHGGDTGSPVTRTGAQPSEAGANREGGGTERADVRPEGRMQQSGVSSDAVGAAEAGFTGDTERGFSKNMATDQSMDSAIQEDFSLDPEMYHTLANKDTLQKANDIMSEGFENAKSKLEQAIGASKNGMKFAPEMVPLARMVANELAKNGDIDSARRILADVAVELTQSGQLGQAAAILRNSGPATMIETVEKSIDKINEAGRKRYGKKWNDFSLTDAEIDAIQNIDGGDTDAFQLEYEKIAKRLGKEMPSTAWEKMTEFRRVSMLLNPKTQIRNVVANVPLMGERKVAEKISGAIQDFLVRSGKLDAKDQTRTFSVSTEAKDMAQKIYEANKETLLNDSNKWDMNSMMRQYRKYFGDTKPGQALDAVREFTYMLLEQGDHPFFKSAFIDSAAQYIAAQGYDSVDTVPQNVIDYATQQAMVATFKDASALADMINKVKRNGGVGSAALDILFPFTTTPINLARRTIDYSPAGILKALNSIRKGEKTQAIDDLSRALTGSAAMAVSVLLAKLGFITGAPDDDKDKRAFDRMNGKQSYSFLGKIGYDWAMPMAAQLATGAAIYDAIKDYDGMVDLLLDTVKAQGDTLAQMTVFSNIKDLLQGYGSPTENIMNTLVSGFAGQLTPSLFGSVARSIDKTVRSSVSGGNVVDDALTAAKAKIPFASKTLPASVDQWGNDIQRIDNAVGRTAQEMLNPANVTIGNTNELEQKLYDLSEETGSKSVFPRVAPYSIDGTKLTGKEREKYQKTLGQNSLAFVRFLYDSDSFNAADANAQTAAIERAYEFANVLARKEYDPQYTSQTWKSALETIANGVSPEDWFAVDAELNLLQNKNDASNNKTPDSVETIQAIEKVGIDDAELAGKLWAAKNSATKSEKNPYTGTLSQYGVTPDEMVEIMTKWNEIDKLNDTNKDIKARDQAAEMSKWLDTQNYNDTQREQIEAMYGFGTRIPAKPTTYDYKTMTDAQKKIWDSPKRVAFGYTDNDMDKFIKNYSIMNSADKKQDKIKALQDSGLSYEEAQLFYRMTH